MDDDPDTLAALAEQGMHLTDAEAALVARSWGVTPAAVPEVEGPVRIAIQEAARDVLERGFGLVLVLANGAVERLDPAIYSLSRRAAAPGASKLGRPTNLLAIGTRVVGRPWFWPPSVAEQLGIVVHVDAEDGRAPYKVRFDGIRHALWCRTADVRAAT